MCVCIFFQSSLHPCNRQNKSFLTEVRRTQIITLHGEGYTAGDTAAKLRCSKTTVHNTIVICNADGLFYDKKRSGRPRKTTPREDSSMCCKKIHAILSLKGSVQHHFETSKEGVWNEIP